MRLVLSAKDADNRPLLVELRLALEESEQHLFAPSAPLLAIVIEFGSILPQSAEYDALFELACRLRSEREGQREAGVTLLKRGLQCLSSDNHISAIQYLARARECLTLNESLAAFSRAV